MRGDRRGRDRRCISTRHLNECDRRNDSRSKNEHCHNTADEAARPPPLDSLAGRDVGLDCGTHFRRRLHGFGGLRLLVHGNTLTECRIDKSQFRANRVVRGIRQRERPQDDCSRTGRLILRGTAENARTPIDDERDERRQPKLHRRRNSDRPARPGPALLASAPKLRRTPLHAATIAEQGERAIEALLRHSLGRQIDRGRDVNHTEAETGRPRSVARGRGFQDVGDLPGREPRVRSPYESGCTRDLGRGEGRSTCRAVQSGGRGAASRTAGKHHRRHPRGDSADDRYTWGDDR